ncbi:MAG: zinc ribbon domain-containing protein [Erysipelotrichia bacterium]|nr:zinc ribbon domain-containing protein [Erysipelotrichia bacterium]
MFCSKCGKHIDDNSRFCTYCGSQTGFAEPVQPGIKVQQKLRNFQNNENVRKAQKSLNGGWSAIGTVLKNPAADVQLGTGEMIVIGIVTVLVQSFGIHLLCTSAFKMAIKAVSMIADAMDMSDYLGSLIGSVSLKVGFGMSLLCGILMTALIFVVYIGAHCASDKSFANWTHYFSHAAAGLIIPSASMMLCGILGSINVVLGAVFGLFAVIDILVHVLSCFKKEDNQYIILLYAAVSIGLLSLTVFLLVKGIISEATILSAGEQMKLKDLLNYSMTYPNYFGY